MKLRAGSGEIKVIGKSFDQYFNVIYYRSVAIRSLAMSPYACLVDVEAHVTGGGLKGQAEAFSQAVARALVNFDPKLEALFQEEKMLETDPRKVERKKYGLYKARKNRPYKRR